MKVYSSNSQQIRLPLVFGVLFFCFLFSSSYNTLFHYYQVLTYKKECALSTEKDLLTKDIETEKEGGEDATNLFVIESKKVKFVENDVNQFSLDLTSRIFSPAYDIHLPPPKVLFS